MQSSKLVIRKAQSGDLRALRGLRVAAADHLTERFGTGHWSKVARLEALRKQAEKGTHWVAEVGRDLVGTFRFTDAKISFYRLNWFADPEANAGYLMQMAIHPDRQRMGYGSACMKRVHALASRQDLSYIRLDSYDSPAGTGAFYRKCGFACVHSGQVNGVPLHYWEKAV